MPIENAVSNKLNTDSLPLFHSTIREIQISCNAENRVKVFVFFFSLLVRMKFLKTLENLIRGRS